MTDRLQRLAKDGKIQFAAVVIAIFVTVFLIILSRYGETGIQEVQGVRRVQTEGEHCAITLPDGWSWRPASWTAISPNGTELGFSESLYGRPEYPDWQEAVDSIVERNAGRPGVTVTVEDELVKVDFGEDGGLSITRKFDRVGCHLTFGSTSAREEEFDTWMKIVDSLERTTPTG